MELNEMLPIDLRSFEDRAMDFLKIESLEDDLVFEDIAYWMADDEHVCNYIFNCLQTRIKAYKSEKLYKIYIKLCNSIVEKLDERAKFVNEAYKKSKEKLLHE